MEVLSILILYEYISQNQKCRETIDGCIYDPSSMGGNAVFSAKLNNDYLPAWVIPRCCGRHCVTPCIVFLNIELHRARIVRYPRRQLWSGTAHELLTRSATKCIRFVTDSCVSVCWKEILISIQQTCILCLSILYNTESNVCFLAHTFACVLRLKFRVRIRS